MNMVSLLGRIGADVELKSFESGNSVASFNMAVKNRDKTNWIRIVAWNKTAELLSTYTKKGDMIGINGRLDVREYEVEGNKRTAYEVVAEQIHFCGGSNKTNANNNPMNFDDSNVNPVEFDEIDPNDDLPF